MFKELFNSKEADSNTLFSKLILPLGISYLIFSLVAYLIEIKRGNIKAEKNLGILASAYLFFPKLAQGPIEKPHNILPQFHSLKEVDYYRILTGLKLIVFGFFKKLIIADRLALYVNAVYNNYQHHNGTSLALATFFFSFQIYADFSGYTDIAIGTAQILGYDLTRNFNRPYFSTSIKEFWNRWHISFSTWLRDYLFLPLAYFLTSKLKNERYLLIATPRIVYMIAIVTTFAICGIWHGEGANYLFWGLLFGIILTYSNWTESSHKKIRKFLNVPKNSKLFKSINILLTFILLSLVWIFFRAENNAGAFEIIRKIFTEHGPVFNENTSDLVYSFFGIIALVAIEIRQEYFTKSALPYESRNWFFEQLFYAVMILLIIVIGVLDGGQFIYFQF